MHEMNPEIRENLNEFVRDLAELSARTGLKVASLLPGIDTVVQTVNGSHDVAFRVRYDDEESVYTYEDPAVLEPEVRALPEQH